MRRKEERGEREREKSRNIRLKKRKKNVAKR